MYTYDAHQTRIMQELQGTPLASFGRRAAAFLLDVLIMSVLFAALAGALEPLLARLGLVRPSGRIVFSLNHGWYNIAWVVVYFGLSTWLGRGRSPGKALLGIRVVSLSHKRLSLWHSLERALGYGASMLEFGFGFLQYFIHPNKRTVHDRIADTIVIRQPRKKTAGPKAKRTSG